jgi:hypothetical protein
MTVRRHTSPTHCKMICMTCSKEILLGTEYTALNGAHIYNTACGRPPVRKRGPVKKVKEVDVVNWLVWLKLRKKKKVSTFPR